MSKPISTEIKDLADQIAKGITFKDGKVEVDANTYVQTLPESISVEQAKAIHKHHSNFFPAATLALGNVALEAMKKDKKLEQVTAEFPMIEKDRFEVTIERRREFPNPQDKEKSTVVFGNVKASMVTQAARASRGSMNHVREQLNADFLSAIGK